MCDTFITLIMIFSVLHKQATSIYHAASWLCPKGDHYVQVPLYNSRLYVSVSTCGSPQLISVSTCGSPQLMHMY